MLQEEGFKLFLQRPENRAVLEEHQRKEARRAEKLAAKQQALSFRDKVSRTRRNPADSAVQYSVGLQMSWQL